MFEVSQVATSIRCKQVLFIPLGCDQTPLIMLCMQMSCVILQFFLVTSGVLFAAEDSMVMMLWVLICILLLVLLILLLLLLLLLLLPRVHGVSGIS